MPEFTPSQKKAIETLGRDIIVTAAAGSGKTAVLSERVLNIILNEGADVTDFLIVTFTNAAAAEMKNRIGNKIADALSNEELSPSKIRHLNKQLSLLARADITTIHSFCLNVIRSNFYFLDIDPRFRILEDGEAQLLKLSAAEEMLEEMYGGKSPELFSNLCRWLGNGDDDILCDRIIKVYEFISSFPHPFGWLDMQVEKYNPKNTGDVDALDWVCEIKRNYKIKLDGLAERAKSICRIAVDNGISSYADTFADDEQKIRRLAGLCEGSWADFHAAAAEFTFSTLGRKSKDDDETLTETLKSSREQIKKNAAKIISVAAKMHPAYISEGLCKMYPLLSCLAKAIASFDNIYKEKKRDVSALDFGDFEHMALSVLRDRNNGVAKKLENKYKYILVDEYQDCNPVQEELFSLICRRENGVSSNMFMVGDIKQSIYKFRQADPEIFINKSRLYDEETTSGERISLNKNFRSSNAVLNYVNHVFSRIMSDYVGEMEYTDSEKLYFRDDYAPPISDKDKCELIIASVDENEDAENKYELEAQVISARILRLINEGYNYKDIVVLYRGMGQKSEALEQQFKNCGIPYYLDSRKGYFETLEVRLFLSLLKIVDNPSSDIPLTGILRSPLFNFDENDLLKIRTFKEGMLFDALKAYSVNTDETGEKCGAFLNKLSVWRDNAISKPIPEFVQYILTDSGLDIFASGLPGGEQRKANLNLMAEYAKSFSAASGGGLFGFVEYMQRLQTHSDTGGAKTLSESSNVVRIMTIHKSKGLEFPVVFLAACHTKFNNRDYSGNLLLHRNLGFGVELYDFDKRVHYPLISKEAVREKSLIENISEEMRVMYVAMTRAKNKLICTGVVNEAKKMEDGWKSLSFGCQKIPLPFMVQSSSYLDWLAYSISDEIILDIMPETQAEISSEPVDFSFEENTPVSDDVREVLEYRYPFLPSSSMPTKFSVSELKRRFDFEDALSAKLQSRVVLKSSSLDEEKVISPAEVGIINHLVLRHIDLQKTSEEDITHRCSELVSDGILSCDEVSYVNTAAIAEFFNSPLGRRLVSAEKVYREESFNILLPQSEISGKITPCENDKVLVQGIIDCMFIENGCVIVVDFKTDKSLSEESENMYKTQLDIYALAAQKITKLPCKEKYLYMLNKGKTVTI